jgi:hypothetical protein
MPLQNRVNPWGQLVAVEARGAWLGNRGGVLHNEQKQIVKSWASQCWITCRLEFKGRRRTIFAPGHYTELFFLDEATSFAAGHRPCGECRRERYNEFKSVWVAANPNLVSSFHPKIAEIDKVIHGERVARGGKKVTYSTTLGELVSGVIFEWNDHAYLLWNEQLYAWSFTGYGAPQPLPADNTQVQVLTPPSIVQMFANGFTPQVHESVS